MNETDLSSVKDALRNAATTKDLIYTALGLVATLSWHAGPGETADLDGAQAVGDALLSELHRGGRR